MGGAPSVVKLRVLHPPVCPRSRPRSHVTSLVCYVDVLWNFSKPETDDTVNLGYSMLPSI